MAQDKGGKLQAPTPEVLEATAPLHPMLWNDLYLLTKVPGEPNRFADDFVARLRCSEPDRLRTGFLAGLALLTRWLGRVPSGVHVLSLGAAEPGNFEEHLKALSYLGTEEGARRVDEGESKHI